MLTVYMCFDKVTINYLSRCVPVTRPRLGLSLYVLLLSHCAVRRDCITLAVMPLDWITSA